jgi:hypothetical protein
VRVLRILYTTVQISSSRLTEKGRFLRVRVLEISNPIYCKEKDIMIEPSSYGFGRLFLNSNSN